MDINSILTISSDATCPSWLESFASQQKWQLVVGQTPTDGLFYKDALSYFHGGKELKLSFDEDFIRHQKMNYSLKNEPLARALGLKGGKRQKIIDLTCGTAKDALLLLAFGAEIFAFERDPFVYCLLKDGLERAEHPDFQFFHLSFGEADSSKLPGEFHAFYFDPMYPEKKKKSSLPRKEMQVFKELVGNDLDAQEKFNELLKIPCQRYVVKRPLKATGLEGPLINSYKGKTTRYDMYQILGSKA